MAAGVPPADVVRCGPSERRQGSPSPCVLVPPLIMTTTAVLVFWPPPVGTNTSHRPGSPPHNLLMPSRPYHCQTSLVGPSRAMTQRQCIAHQLDKCRLLALPKCRVHTARCRLRPVVAEGSSEMALRVWDDKTWSYGITYSALATAYDPSYDKGCRLRL